MFIYLFFFRIACFEMEEYESAKEAFDLSRKFNDTALVRRWIRKCDAEIEEEEGGAVHVNQKTSAPTSFDVKSIPSVRAEDTLNDPIIPVKTSIRHEWYQSPTNVVITVYARNKAKEDCKVDAKETTLSINIKLSEDSDFVLDLNLCDTIYPEQTKIECYPTKVEVKLTKKKQCKWLTLEKSEKEQISTLDWDTSGIMKPEYPSSSKIKKNWDAIDKSVEEEKLQGEQALNKVFQDIFSRGSDEQRRAMEKSFVESGGTVLSTNWEDVGSRYVEGSAPKGAELKKWNE